MHSGMNQITQRVMITSVTIDPVTTSTPIRMSAKVGVSSHDGRSPTASYSVALSRSRISHSMSIDT